MPMGRTLVAAAISVVLIVIAACGDDVTPATASPVSCKGKKALVAAGSSAQSGIIAEFARAYSRSCRGHTLSYRSIGSGAGRAEFAAGLSDIGGTDVPLGADPSETERAVARCGGNPVWNLPLVFSAVGITYNVPGLDSLILDAPSAAKIFSGAIKDWNAPEITALNPGRDLPDIPIVVIYRTDASGSTDSFQRYLQAASGAAWGRGIDESFNGIRGKGVMGNEGAWAAIKRTPGSITYSAWSFAETYGLSVARIVTSAGPDPVTLSAESVGRSIAGVTVTGQGNDIVLDLSSTYRPSRLGAYPIVLTTYEVVCSRYPDGSTAESVRDFLTVALRTEDDGLRGPGHVSVPGLIVDRLSSAIESIS